MRHLVSKRFGVLLSSEFNNKTELMPSPSASSKFGLSILKFFKHTKFFMYSSVPNRRAGPNKRAGGKILQKH